MTKRFALALIACIALAMLVLPASAALNVVPAGGTVFIGEDKLDVRAGAGTANPTTIAWYNPGDVPGTAEPAKTLDINPAQMYVSPGDFVGRTGNWYVMGTKTVAFSAADPQIEVKIWDNTAEKDVTSKSVPAGNMLNFRVETNLKAIASRDPNVTGFDFKIKVKTADGATYTNLFYTTTASLKLTDLLVNAQPWYWAPQNNKTVGWKTDVLDEQNNRRYKAGVYTIYAECNVNGMKDNYKDPSGSDYTGKTISSTRTVTIASDSVKIEASKDTVVRGNAFSVTVTGNPNTEYYLWIKGCGQMSGQPEDQPPLMSPDQDSVKNDPVGGNKTIGEYKFEGGAGRTIYQDVPHTPNEGVYYYAKIKTSNSNTRTIEFRTAKETKDKKYTIRVERQNDDGSYKSDEVDVKVEKGAVTVVASGDSSYFLGEEVKLTGTNSETDYTYLFITGPNLPSTGGSLTDPRKRAVSVVVDPNTEELFTRADVKEDNTWEYKWQTANLNIDAGTYTIYAAASAANKDQLDNVQYGTVSVIIRKPFVSAIASQSVVARGDKFYIRGNAQGNPSPGVQIWILGKNYAVATTEGVNSDASFEFEVKSGLTSNMATGQYFVVVQHPMYNDKFDIFRGTQSDNKDYVVGPYPDVSVQNKIFKLYGAGALQGSDAAEALIQAINNAMVDDTYTKLQFLVEEPKIQIKPVGEKSVGDKFTLEGTTNLAVDDELIAEIYSSSFKNTPKTQSGEFSGITGTVKVQKGTEGLNKWSFPVDTSTFKPDEYIISVSGITVSATDSALFNVVEFKATPVPTTVVTTVAANTTPATPKPTTPAQTTVPATPIPTTTKSPGFGALVALIGLGAVAFLVVRRH